jgi:hypothetical protein
VAAWFTAWLPAAAGTCGGSPCFPRGVDPQLTRPVPGTWTPADMRAVDETSAGFSAAAKLGRG